MHFVAVFDKFESEGRYQFRRSRLAEFDADKTTEALPKAREENKKEEFKGWRLIRIFAVAYEIGTKGEVEGLVCKI